VRRGHSSRARQAHPEDGIGSKPPLVGGAIQLDENSVKDSLIERIEPEKRPAPLMADDFDAYSDATGYCTSGKDMVFRVEGGQWSTLTPDEIQAAQLPKKKLGAKPTRLRRGMGR